jgi:predicted helicase
LLHPYILVAFHELNPGILVTTEEKKIRPETLQDTRNQEQKLKHTDMNHYRECALDHARCLFEVVDIPTVDSDVFLPWGAGV